MKSLLIQSAAVILAGTAIGSLAAPWHPAEPSSVPQKPIDVQRVIPFQAASQAAMASGTPLTITISGTGIIDGTFTAQEVPSSGERRWIIASIGIPQHCAHVYRAVYVDPASGKSFVAWKGFAWIQDFGGGRAANGQWVNLANFTEPPILISDTKTGGGDPINDGSTISGSMGWVGNAFNGSPPGGGRTVTISVGP